MTRKTYGLIAGLVAAAGVGAWWWRVRTGVAAPEFRGGTVIFDNTPRASMPDGNLNL